MKLNTIIIEQDKTAMKHIKELCIDSELVNVVGTFNDSLRFVNEFASLDFDICLLSLHMPAIDGLTIAKYLHDRPFIFVTGTDIGIKDALELSPSDILIRPIYKDRLEKALIKAYSDKLFKEKIKSMSFEQKPSIREFHCFSVGNETGRVKIRVADIVFVQSNLSDPRNKELFLKDNRCYLIKNYSFEEIAELCSHLIRINRSEMVSANIVDTYTYDNITLDNFKLHDGRRNITLGRACRKEFRIRMEAF
jgi:DNA-binding LytR/AlgR family response regulator